MPKPHKVFSGTKRALFLIALFCVFIGFIPKVHAGQAYIPNDPYFKHQWYMRQIHAPEAWAVTKGNKDVTVAVIDGGMDISHPDLRDAIWTNPNEIPGDGLDNDQNGFIDDVHGWNFTEHSGDVMQMAGPHQTDTAWAHGTMNASLIAAEGNNRFGIAGVAWGVTVLPVVVLDMNGFGGTRDIAQAIDYATDMGADIINISLFGFEDDANLTAALRRANEKDVLIVAAVGNEYSRPEGLNLDWTPTVPACSETSRNGVLGVTATDVLDQHAKYANTGTRCVDLSAPGYGIITAHPTEAIPFPEYAEEAETRDVVFDVSGTSVAAPLVSGSAALIKSMRPDWSKEQIIAQLLATSDAIGGTRQMDDPAPLGWGRLNVGRAISELPPPAPQTASVTGMESGLSSEKPEISRFLKQGLTEMERLRAKLLP